MLCKVENTSSESSFQLISVDGGTIKGYISKPKKLKSDYKINAPKGLKIIQN